MTSTSVKILTAGLVFSVMAQPAIAREQVHVVGSSTVYPFTTSSAEQFGQGGKFKTPIVESTGTGGGFKLFCEGVGDDKADINDASRKMTDSEKETCAKNGVTDVVEIPIGFDGIVFANKKGGTALDLSKKDIFLALARMIPDGSGKLTENTYQTWDQVNPKLPKMAITVYGPPPTSGTRDAFVELVMEAGCESFKEFEAAYPDKKERAKTCHNLREDGKYIDSGEDDNIIVQKLVADPNAVGIFGYSYYDNNRAKIQSAKIDGIAPDFANIESGKYGVSRGLYVYVKAQHIGITPGLAEFLKELTSNNSIGKGGYNLAKGLLPLPEAELKVAQGKVKGLMSQMAKK